MNCKTALILQGRQAAAGGVVFLGEGSSPEGHDGVPLVFVDDPAAGQDDVGHGREVTVQQGHHLFGSEFFGHAGKPGQVGEEDGEDSFLPP
jgi:hypothetical protein